MDITALLNPGDRAPADQTDGAMNTDEAGANIFLSEFVGTEGLLITLSAGAVTLPFQPVFAEGEEAPDTRQEVTQSADQIAEVLEGWSGISARLATVDPSRSVAEPETITAQGSDEFHNAQSPTQISADETRETPSLTTPSEQKTTVKLNPDFHPKQVRSEGISHPQITDPEINLPLLRTADNGILHDQHKSPQSVESTTASPGSHVILRDPIAPLPISGQPESKQDKTELPLTIPPAARTEIEAPSGQRNIAATVQPLAQNLSELNSINIPSRSNLDLLGSTELQPGTNSRPAIAYPPTIARQIADIVITTKNEMVEITLIPEELGRIRMILTGQERAPHLTLWVERPEILDQMRRHSNDLLQEFHKEGMADATLDFQDGRRFLTENGKDDSDTNDPEEVGETMKSGATSGPAINIYRMQVGMSGIDIRV